MTPNRKCVNLQVNHSRDQLDTLPTKGGHEFVSVLSLPATSTYVVQTTLQKHKHNDSTQGKALAQTDAEGRFPPRIHDFYL